VIRRRTFIWLLLIGAALSLLYLNQTSDVATTGYDIADLENQQQLLTMQNEQLRLQIAQLESLDRVDREATARLHMGPPRRVLYTTGPVVAVPTPTPSAVSGTPIAGSPLTWAWRWITARIASLVNAAPTGPVFPAASNVGG